MGKYLKKFQDTIRKKQTEQILNLLNKQRNTGQIRSVEEFSQKLNSLIRELTNTELTPILKLFMANPEEEINSEQFNTMLDRVEDDLEAAFQEALQIDEVQKSHQAIVKDVILKNLRSAVNELETKISAYEFIKGNSHGFDGALFSSFKESKRNRTLRKEVNTENLFTDPRTEDIILNTNDAYVELVGDRLSLPSEQTEYIDIEGIQQLFDSSAPQSELSVEPPGLSLNNIIDNTNGTYWIQSLLFTKKPSYIKVQLELDLGITREINFVEIEPASKYSLILESINYLDINNSVVTISSDEIDITSNTKIYIPKISARKIILTFKNKNADEIHFQYDKNQTDNLLNQLASEPPEGYNPNISFINSELRELVSSSTIKALINVKNEEYNEFDGYEFITGFDNIKVGISKYLDTGIYITSPLQISDYSHLGLKTVESRPYLDKSSRLIKFTNTTYDIDSDSTLTDDSSLSTEELSNTYFQSSIEYWLIKQEINKNGDILRTTTFPILPLDKDRIHHERLLLTEKSASTLSRNDLGQTIFYTNTTSTQGNIKVYKNGYLMEDQTGNSNAASGWKNYSVANDSIPNTGTPMRFRIQILNPQAGDIYTVSYNPVLSTCNSIPSTLATWTKEGAKLVDLVGNNTAYITPFNIIYVTPTDSITEEVRTRIYLSIILRQNTANTSLSPFVEEYTLLYGQRDLTKFEGF